MNVARRGYSFRPTFLVASAAPAASSSQPSFYVFGVLVVLLFSCEFVVDAQCTLGEYGLMLLDNVCKRKLMRMNKFWD
jgi:hypothetical protein